MESHRKLTEGLRKEWIETSQNAGSGGRSLLVPHSMSKIRINELARELEVKPSVILDLLPELGIHDKKTHSSSLDDDVALIVRRHVAGGGGAAAFAAESETEAPASHTSSVEAAAPAPEHAPAPPSAEAPARVTPEVTTEAAPEASPKEAVEAAPAPVRPVVAPLRPPLASQQASSQPIVPPLGSSVPAPTAAAPSAAPGVPRGIPIPSRPVPPAAPKPGQILSGPRQPLPPPVTEARRTPAPPPTAHATSQGPSPAAPAAPRLPSIPIAPSPARPAPRPPYVPPSAPGPGAPQAAHSGPGAPQTISTGGGPLRPPAKPNLAGQPAARPVVPPRPDLAAKLSRPPSPGVPLQPRPGMPTRPSSPVPGRPIYTGPVRPGQPLMRGPGGPGGGPGGPPGMRGRTRPMHPTSPLRPEPATLPTDPGRRHATKPGSRDRRREVDQEEGRLRPVARREQAFEPPPIDREITVAEGCTVKELSEKLGVKANLLIKKLVEKKTVATINQTLDVKMAEDLARDFGAATNKVSYEQETTHEIEQTEVDQDREKRPPVVTIMGHVDHGKTSLLDAIRLSNVAEHEAGGITQHIGAYHVEKNGKKIVFIDTPGHEAFTRMRARGAKVTDIVVLVVAADDGVMPQTLEAIDHAKAAKVPIIVAINKIDKPDAQPDRIKQQLADRGLLGEDWGGNTEMVPVSAKTHQNLDLLLEMILLVAELQDLKANPSRPAMGTVIEAQLDRGRGPVATVLVRNGTLAVGDFFIVGSVFGKVRAMLNDRGVQIRKAEPATPVEVLGLDSLPEAGDDFQVVTDTAKAKQIVGFRDLRAREAALAKNSRLTLEQLHKKMEAGEVKELPLIIKADVGGSAEVLTETLQKLSNDKVKVRVIHSGVGAITESDVLLASASNAIIIGFNVRPERKAEELAEQDKVDIRLHSIIYELQDEIKRAMSGLLEPTFKETYQGRAEVLET